MCVFHRLSVFIYPFYLERLSFPSSNLSLSVSTCLCPLLCGHTRHAGNGTERVYHFEKKAERFQHTDCRASLLLLHLEQKYGRVLLPVQTGQNYADRHVSYRLVHV